MGLFTPTRGSWVKNVALLLPVRNRCGASGRGHDAHGAATLLCFLNHFSQLVSQRELQGDPVLTR